MLLLLRVVIFLVLLGEGRQIFFDLGTKVGRQKHRLHVLIFVIFDGFDAADRPKMASARDVIHGVETAELGIEADRAFGFVGEF